ncbi:MAG: hypothetical protein V6Z86_01385 [Hyphomicrobiales bacterium]
MREYAAYGTVIGSLGGPLGRTLGVAVGAVVGAKSKECKPKKDSSHHDGSDGGGPHRA